MIRLKCLQCGEDFKIHFCRLKKGERKFCSKKCFYLSLEKKISKICKYCEKEFEVPIFRNKAKYCSRKCADSAGRKRKRIMKICKYCDKEFEVIPSSNKIYCSRECVNKSKVGKFVGEKSPSWKGGMIKYKCKICEKSFFGGKNQGRSKHIFCSQKCYGEWLSKNIVGESHPNWLNGKSFEAYGIEFNNELKGQVRKRDKYKCQICDKKQRKQKLGVHHIDYDKENNIMRNLISLCRSCHSKTNFKRDSWQVFFENEIRKIYKLKKVI